METIRYLEGQATRWQIGASTYVAIPERGARLLEWKHTRSDGGVRDVIYWPRLETLEGFEVVRGGNPILFPFCARTFDRGAIHFWRDDDGVVRPMPLHGFARQSRFRVTALDETGFTAVLMADADARATYPFDYEFIVRYRFGATALLVDLELRNLGTVEIPWSAGHHFYVTAPWSEGRARADYLLDLPPAKSCRQDAQGRLMAAPHFKAPVRLSEPELCSTTHFALQGNEVRVVESGSGSAIRFSTHYTNTSPRDAAFTTWTQDDESPYYCLEPWMGPPNSPETGVGLHRVPAGSSQRFTVEMALEPQRDEPLSPNN